VRLLLLYVLACAVAVGVGLLWRATLEAGVGLNRTPVRADSGGAQPPFAGVNVQIEAYPVAAARLATLNAAGFGWARQRIAWRVIEPEPDHFDWRIADRIVALLVEAGLEPVIVLNGAPVWAMAEVDRGLVGAPPADFADFAGFVEAFARRYGDHIRYYQIWDEPNIAPNWGSRHINPVEYAQMLRAVAPAIRSADADAVILAAALAPTVDRGHLAIDEVHFLQRMVAAGAAPFFDVVAIQPFGFGYSPQRTRQQIDTLNFARAGLIRRTLVDAGLGDKPIWAVRYGWNRMLNSPWATVTPAAQAAYARAALDRAWREWPWLAAMGWVIDQPNEPSGMPSWGFALTSANGRPAPVFAALAEWQTTERSPQRSPSPSIAWLSWIGLSLGAVLIGWRTTAATQLLPWRIWLMRYRGASVWVHVAAWIVLIAIYYLATYPPLIVLCWLAAGWLCFAQPHIGLWLALAFIPFHFQHKEVHLVNATLTVAPAHVLTVALAPALISLHRRRRDITAQTPESNYPLFWWELILLLLIPMTLLTTVNVWRWPAFVRGTIDLVIAPILLWWAVRSLASSEAGRRRALLVLFAGGVLAALSGLAGWLLAQGAEVDGIRRLVGPHFSPNHTALYLERSLFVGLAALLVAASHWRLPLLLAVLTVAAALVLTGSRGALLLGAPAGFLALALLSLYRRPALARWLRIRQDLQRWFWLGAGLLIVAILLWQRERFANLETLELRLELWMAATALWRDHFWAGVGPGGFFWNYPAYLRVGAVEVDQLHPHNVWLELVTTWGVWGLAWFTLCLAGMVAAMRRHRRVSNVHWWVAAGACAGLAAGLAHAQTDAFWLLADLAAWNAAAWALATTPVAEEDVSYLTVIGSPATMNNTRSAAVASR
jgi:O-antigen ligase